jgi:predicted alpha/beta superfamily hydrolase
MKKVLLFTIFVCFQNFIFGQVTINISAVSSNTPNLDNIFIAGSFNNWNPGDDNYKLVKSGSIYTIILPAGTGQAEYKFTRGSWATVEGDANGNVIPNRSFTYTLNGIENISIAGWEDKKSGGGSGSTALQNVSIISNTFFIPQLNKTRRVWIYLPSDYNSNLNKRYPVLYLHDGQNCFDKTTAFSGEWGIDETLSNKEKNGDKGCIAVAIDNGGSSRLDEYSPYNNPQYGGGQGDAYVDFLALTLKPYIDSAYRTFTNKANTAMAGSSMGGLITTYAMFKYPNLYGKAGIFSPAYWFSNQLFTYVLSKSKSNNQKFYFVCGRTEGGSMAKWQDSMNIILQQKGYNEGFELRNVIKPNGAHNEAFWRAEFGDCYDWLFSDLKVGIKKNEDLNPIISIYPNPNTNGLLYFDFNGNVLNKKVQIFNALGVLLNEFEIQSQLLVLDKSKYLKGLYFLKIENNNQIIKLVVE